MIGLDNLISDKIEQLVATMTPELNIQSVTDNGDDTYTLELCKTLYITKCAIIEIDGNQYEVISFVYNVSALIKPLGS